MMHQLCYQLVQVKCFEISAVFVITPILFSLLIHVSTTSTSAYSPGCNNVFSNNSIRVINEGDIAGYAKEVKDYVPEGLKFVAEDNPGWTDLGNNVISTNLLENTLLQPGEFPFSITIACVTHFLKAKSNSTNFKSSISTSSWSFHSLPSGNTSYCYRKWKTNSYRNWTPTI